MRISSIRASWFRGAASSVALEPGSKSMVVYGTNASGKSTFADVVEYVLKEGRIRHLSHEYSGKRLVRAVPNTHKPADATPKVTIELADGSKCETVINPDGSYQSSGTASGTLAIWAYQRTVLRQDEVAAFIHETKGGKYSALLPLLGLHHMEVAAENLRQLVRSVENVSKVKETSATLALIGARRKTTFGDMDDAAILERIEALHLKYCPDNATTIDPLARCNQLIAALDTQVNQLTAEQRRHVVLEEVSAADIQGAVAGVRAAFDKLSAAVDPMVTERLAVLRPTATFAEKIDGTQDIACPACGRLIPIVDLRTHVTRELELLREMEALVAEKVGAMGALSDAVKIVKSHLAKSDVKSWRERTAQGGLIKCFGHLDSLTPEGLRSSCSLVDLSAIEENLTPLIDAAKTDSAKAQPSVQLLLADKRTVEVAKAVLDSASQEIAVNAATRLMACVAGLERNTRGEIRQRCEDVIAEISDDIQNMWTILHPGEAIDQVRLYLPDDTDKAIDVGLQFYGKEQDSPRLTLSEGYRNSLGLCIFLAMAKREEAHDRPLILDDVVVSLDRNHRGMIVTLLNNEFNKRQVIILTHDRDWYAELRHQLESGDWKFRALLPYSTPAMGIRWSNGQGTFEEARAQVAERPDTAANDVRKIMDVELALIAERVGLKMPFLRLDKNDRRTAHDFLDRIVADGSDCLQELVKSEHKACPDKLAVLRRADDLLVTWGNRGSHSFDVSAAEAGQLIDVCEQALGVFACVSCNKKVWFTDNDASKWVQCQCGALRWRYGKS